MRSAEAPLAIATVPTQPGSAAVTEIVLARNPVRANIRAGFTRILRTGNSVRLNRVPAHAASVATEIIGLFFGSPLFFREIIIEPIRGSTGIGGARGRFPARLPASRR